jgi:hypothetical protein
MASMMTPWGLAKSVFDLEPGIVFVLTDEHGGLIVAPDYAEKKLSHPARSRAVRFLNFYAYEMDGNWAIALWELPRLLGVLREKVALDFKISSEQDLKSALSTRYPDYLKDYWSLKSYTLCRP